MKTKVTTVQAQALADRTAAAYSCDRYASWKACAAVLLRHGYTDRQAATILRSRIARWAADTSNARYGYATSKDLMRCIYRNYPSGVSWFGRTPTPNAKGAPR